MREIKFRGKDIGSGEWVYGFYTQGGYINPNNGEETLRHIISDTILHDVDPETVGQFTGLYDKNGKEVYEGDIVNRIDIALKRNHIGKVVYSEQTASFYLEVDNGTYSTMERFVKQESFNDGKAVINCKYEYEVLGNMYDNKELLKGE